MSQPSVVTVTDFTNTRVVPINGGGLTVLAALANFLGASESDVADQLGTRKARLLNYGDLNPTDFGRQLAHGDTITIYTNAVATGGVKGAAH